MRMLRQSPGIADGIRPNCEAFGYILDNSGHCQYVDAYNRELEKNEGKYLFRIKHVCVHNFVSSEYGHVVKMYTG